MTGLAETTFDPRLVGFQLTFEEGVAAPSLAFTRLLAIGQRRGELGGAEVARGVFDVVDVMSDEAGRGRNVAALGGHEPECLPLGKVGGHHPIRALGTAWVDHVTASDFTARRGRRKQEEGEGGQQFLGEGAETHLHIVW